MFAHRGDVHGEAVARDAGRDLHADRRQFVPGGRDVTATVKQNTHTHTRAHAHTHNLVLVLVLNAGA